MQTTNEDRVYLKEKLVMNINADPDRIDVVDRINIHMVRTKKYKTKSDAVFSLLKMALDQVDRDERETLDKTRKAVAV